MPWQPITIVGPGAALADDLSSLFVADTPIRLSDIHCHTTTGGDAAFVVRGPRRRAAMTSIAPSGDIWDVDTLVNYMLSPGDELLGRASSGVSTTVNALVMG